MIRVEPQPEPADFDSTVRQPGLLWLRRHRVPLAQPPPDPTKLPTHWRKCQKALWDAYHGVCAYLCIYFAWPLGASSTDHFVAKSKEAGKAYEWSNFRLSCMGMNRNKNRFDDILDPFEIEPNTFVLNLANGEIKPNPDLPGALKERADETIKRLQLDDPETNKMRAEHYSDFLRGDVSAEWLRRRSPFVWHEGNRQRLL